MSQFKTAIDIQLNPGLARQISEAMGLLKGLDKQGRETAAILGKLKLGNGIFESIGKLKTELGGIAATAVHGNQQIIASYAAMGGKLANEMRGLKGVSAEVASAMNREFKGAFSSAQSEIAGLNRQIAEMSNKMRGMGGGGRSIRHGAHTGGGIVDTIAMGPQHSGVYAGLNVEHGLVGGLLEANGELQRQLNLYRLGGAKEADVAAARSAAFRSSVLVPDVGVAEQMKLYRELSGATGDDAGARMILPQVAKTMSVMEAITGQHSDAAMKQLFKFIELRGVAIDEHSHKIDVGKFGGELDYATKAMVAAQGLITSNDMLQFTKQAGSMAKGMSGEDLFTTMLAAVEDMGGARAGTSLTAVGRQFLGGVMTGTKADRLDELGLLGKTGVDRTGTHAVITDPTKGIVGYDVLTKEGFGAFMEKVFRPHLAEHGITGRQQQNEELYRSVGTDTARRLMGLYLSGHEQVGIVAERYRKAMPGGEGYDKIFGSGQDLQTSTKALSEAFQTLKTALGDAPAVSQSLMTFARAVAGVADMVKDHPALGTAATLGGVGASASLLGFGALQTVKGFGLPAAAAELTTAAKMLQAAAGGPGGVPGQPGGKPGLWGTIAGALGLYTLAEGAQANNVLAAPKAGDGFWKNVLNFLDPGLAARVIGEEIKKPAEEAGKAAGAATTKGFGSEDYQGAGGTAGTSLLRGFLNIFSQMGANGIQPTSFGGGGLSGLIQKASLGGGGGFTGTFGGRALAVGGGTGIGHVASQAERAAYIRATAASLGINPEVALRVAQSEGFNQYVGDQGRSFGDFQLFTGGGIGNQALAAGINIRDPRNWKAADRFALEVAARKRSWVDWHGARRVGIGDHQGFGEHKAPPTAGAPPRQQMVQVTHYTTLDGKVLTKTVSQHLAKGGAFPGSTGGPDTYGNHHGPSTHLTDAA